MAPHAAADCEFVEIVSTEVAEAPEGVMLDGLNEQADPAGTPEQAKLTLELKPYFGVTVSVTVPWLPELTVSEAGDACNVKVGGGPILITYAAEATALFVYPPATAIACRVSVVETVMAPPYTADAVVGAVPSVV